MDIFSKIYPPTLLKESAWVLLVRLMSRITALNELPLRVAGWTQKLQNKRGAVGGTLN